MRDSEDFEQLKNLLPAKLDDVTTAEKIRIAQTLHRVQSDHGDAQESQRFQYTF